MKLLCIDDSRHPASKHFQNWVVEGEVYTIRRKEGSLTGETRVLLNEIKNEPIFVEEFQAKVEPGFNIKRFSLCDDAMNLVGEESNVEVKETALVLN